MMDFVQEMCMMQNRRCSKCPSHKGVSLGVLCDKKCILCHTLPGKPSAAKCPCVSKPCRLLLYVSQ